MQLHCANSCGLRAGMRAVVGGLPLPPPCPFPHWPLFNMVPHTPTLHPPTTPHPAAPPFTHPPPCPFCPPPLALPAPTPTPPAPPLPILGGTAPATPTPRPPHAAYLAPRPGTGAHCGYTFPVPPPAHPTRLPTPPTCRRIAGSLVRYVALFPAPGGLGGQTLDVDGCTRLYAYRTPAPARRARCLQRALRPILRTRLPTTAIPTIRTGLRFCIRRAAHSLLTPYPPLRYVRRAHTQRVCRTWFCRDLPPPPPTTFSSLFMPSVFR